MSEICGDIPLSGTSRLRYVINGFSQIVRSFGSRYPVQPVRLDLNSEEVRSKTREGASPLRVYTCAVAERLVVQYLAKDGPICDIGCGGGGQSRFFEKWGARHFYLGVDIASHPRWYAVRSPGNHIPCRFAQMSAVDLGLRRGTVAFTFSSSALEHVPNIHQATCEIARVMQRGAYGLHIVPGVWSLFLYVFHGYRRFWPKMLAEVFEQAGLEIVQMWSLGGAASFLLHGVWITCLETFLMPKLLRRAAGYMRNGSALQLYSRLLKLALRLDSVLPFVPASYGVLVRKP